MLDHPVGCCLPESLSIFVDDGLLVIERLCIVDEPFAIAFQLCEGCVFAIIEFFLSLGVSVVPYNADRDGVTAAGTRSGDCSNGS